MIPAVAAEFFIRHFKPNWFSVRDRLNPALITDRMPPVSETLNTSADDRWVVRACGVDPNHIPRKILRHGCDDANTLWVLVE